MLYISLHRIVALLPLICTLAYSQPQGSALEKGNVRAESEYVLGSGDQIVLHVVDLDEVSDKPIRIDPNGYIDLPLAGRIKASGLSIEQLKTEMAKDLSKYIQSPRITINLTDDQNQPVSVIGAVNSPGVHQLQGPKRLIEVISLAGGLRPDAGSKVVITRQMRWGVLALPNAKVEATGEFSTAELSLDSLLTAKNPAENIAVKPNDVVAVPKADVVYVVGDVKRAGGFPLSSHEAISLLQALSLAEGLDHDAAPRKARILRPSGGPSTKVDEIPVDIQKIFDGKAPDVQLYANDVLFVPDSISRSSAKRAAEAVLQVATGVVIYRH